MDYLVVSHFHGDHYGELTPNSKQGSVSSFKRTGITDVGDLFTIGTLLDRGYPKYDFPVNLGAYYQEPESTFLNYLAFVNAKVKQGTRAEMLKAGSNHQILLKRNPQQYPEFKVQNVKVNGTIWTGNAEETVVHFTADSVLSPQGKFNENPLSMAIKISYGNFDYFTGADNTGLRGYGLPTWFDTETPMAKAIGKVEVMTLNHHGNRDATNETFLKATQPKVAIQQIWCSDQPGQEVMHRLGLKPKPDVFALHLQEETKTYLGFWLNQIYKSTDGHVMIRVSPGGKQFWVGVLDDTKAELSLKRWFGPYYCY
ncbi:hypothetical protein BWI96_19155 [Siphonobacter sp. SORGH_AS_0500]|uniref:hypothetical protein n=1 Tax=Siphonobacter sp. SORGH_AS_0500 TaxID=1864824 RepID=UPI000CC1A5C4|nr:hypothetical protein [Siphonobacter sp. SORGH_AS_0500]PKK35043.1 hypothetical protein BWI96_19155 [Siphonobacter sp. SORGH_AS_0500]